MSVILIASGLLLCTAGLAGCVLPIIPGPPVSYIGLLLVCWADASVNWTLVIVMGVITAVVTVFDYAMPVMGARKYGASQWGVGGSMLGMLIGLFFIPPFGIFIGTFIGAVLGELLAGKKYQQALKAGWGTFAGTMAGTLLKLVTCAVLLGYGVYLLFT